MHQFIQESELLGRAYEIALWAHEGQTRSGPAKTPYINHCVMVASMLHRAGATENQIAAGLLHDSREDIHPAQVGILNRKIIRYCNREVEEMVWRLTTLRDINKLPVREKKLAQYRFLKEKASPEVHLVKAADIIDNLISLRTDRPVKWNEEKCLLYIEGSSMIFEGICRGLNSYIDTLYDGVYRSVSNYYMLPEPALAS